MLRFIRLLVAGTLVLCIGVTLPVVLLADEYKDAKKAYENGQHEEALRLVLVKLRKDNQHQDAIQLFKTVVKLVVDKHQNAAEEAETAQNWEGAIREYDALRRISTDLASVAPMEEVRENGKKLKKPVVMPAIDIRAQRQNAVNRGAETHYQQGVTLSATPGGAAEASAEFDAAMRLVPDYKDSRQLAAAAFYRDAVSLASAAGNSERAAKAFDAAMRYVPNYRDSRQVAADCLYRDGVAANARKDYKAAVTELRLVSNYVPGYKDAEVLADKAKLAATRRIAVMPFTNVSGKAQFGEVGQIMTDQIISGAMDSHPEFMEFVTRDYVNQLLEEQKRGQSGAINETTAAKIGKLAGIHAFVFGKVLSVTVSYPPELAENYTNTVTLCSGISLFGVCPQGQAFNVTANYTKHTLQGYVEITGSFQIIDVDKGTIIKSDSITNRKSDRADWVTYSGDQRAIPEAVRTSGTGQRSLEPAEQLAQNAMQQIAKELAGNLVQFFR